MAVKTFTTGEVLTAADTNTYLNNGGLVYVSGATFSNATTVDVTGFTATYSQFRVIYFLTRHSGSGGSAVSATYRDASTGYLTGFYGGGVSSNYLGTVAAYGARNNGADMAMGSVYDANSPNRGWFDVGGMNSTVYRPTLTGSFYDISTSANVSLGYEYAGTRTISPDRIRLTCAVGMTGTWQLYGYRTA